MKNARRTAFSLVELILSMAVMTVLMGALGSAMVIASKAVPSRASPLAAAVDAASVVDQLAGELFTTKAITARSDKMVEFQLADRNGDGMDEIVRYEWSGSAAASLSRKFNAQPAATILSDVSEFKLEYDLVANTTTTTPPPGESGEMVFFNVKATAYLQDNAVTDKKWIGQYFYPTLPGNATAWRVTRVAFRARSKGSNKGLSRLQLQVADKSGLPSGTIVEEAELFENTLTSAYTDQEVKFSNAGGLVPGNGMCFIVKWVSDTDSCEIENATNLTPPSGTVHISTNNSGVNWSQSANQSMNITVYGAYTAPGAPTTSTRNFLTGVRIRLRAGTNASSAVESKVRVLNEPEAF